MRYEIRETDGPNSSDMTVSVTRIDAASLREAMQRADAERVGSTTWLHVIRRGEALARRAPGEAWKDPPQNDRFTWYAKTDDGYEIAKGSSQVWPIDEIMPVITRIRCSVRIHDSNDYADSYVESKADGYWVSEYGVEYEIDSLGYAKDQLPDTWKMCIELFRMSMGTQDLAVLTPLSAYAAEIRRFATGRGIKLTARTIHESISLEWPGVLLLWPEVASVLFDKQMQDALQTSAANRTDGLLLIHGLSDVQQGALSA